MNHSGPTVNRNVGGEEGKLGRENWFCVRNNGEFERTEFKLAESKFMNY